MQLIRAKARYEVEGKTILDVYHEFIRDDNGELPKVGDQITFFSAMNDSPAIHETDRYLARSIMIVDELKEYPAGYYVTVSLDVNSLPTTKRALDGYTRKHIEI